MKKTLAVFISALAMATLFVLVGCGGGGSSSSNYTTLNFSGYNVEIPAAFQEETSGDSEAEYAVDKFYTATIDEQSAQLAIFETPKDLLMAEGDSLALMRSFITEMSGAGLNDVVEGSIDGQPSISASSTTDFGSISMTGSIVAVELKNGNLLMVSVNEQGSEFTEGLADYAQNLSDHISLA